MNKLLVNNINSLFFQNTTKILTKRNIYNIIYLKGGNSMNTETREYNFNATYIQQILKIKNVNREKLCKRLGFTDNCLYHKLSGRTLIYIEEACIIANEFGMTIEDIFCPTSIMIFDAIIGQKISSTTNKYRPYNFNEYYIKEIVYKKRNLKTDDLCNMWGLKRTSIYDKLANRTKIHIREALTLSNTVGISINNLFCPTKNQILKTMERKHTLTNGEVVTTPATSGGFTKINTSYVKQLIKHHGLKIIELSQIWGFTKMHVYNKINGDSPINIEEALDMSKWLNLPLDTIFNPTVEDMKQIGYKDVC